MIMSRGLGYTDSELEALLDIIEEVLPRSPNEWEAISRRHIENYPGHTQDSIRRKFNSLANHKKTHCRSKLSPHGSQGEAYLCINLQEDGYF